MIYFDHNAGTLISDKVLNYLKTLGNESYNASSVHSNGRKARNIIEKSRKNILQYLNATNSKRLIFTSSASEANNLAFRIKNLEKIFISSMEHPSILNIDQDFDKINIDKEGRVNLEELNNKLALNIVGNNRGLVSIMQANNETGIIQPIEEIIKIVKSHNYLLHSDITQSFGKINIDLSVNNIDMLSLSGHKIGSIQGVGALILNKDLELNALIKGGAQEYNMRAGTENITAIQSLNYAIEDLPDFSKILEIRNFIEKEITKITKDAIIFGKNVERLPNTICVTMPNVTAQTQLMEFDINNICVSSGSACSSGKITESYVLKAMNIAEKDASCAIRISLGRHNNMTDAAKFIEIWEKLYKRVNNVR